MKIYMVMHKLLTQYMRDQGDPAALMVESSVDVVLGILGAVWPPDDQKMMFHYMGEWEKLRFESRRGSRAAIVHSALSTKIATRDVVCIHPRSVLR